MRDLYLRFADADEMELALLEFGFKEDEEQGGLHYPDIGLDVAGVMYEPVSPEDEDPDYVELPGFHVNMRVIDDQLDMTALDDYIIHPKTPSRVWA